MECEACGCDALEPVDGRTDLLRCTLCGELGGDPLVVRRELESEEASRRGIDMRIFPLVKALESLVDGIEVVGSNEGRRSPPAPPFIQMAADRVSGWKALVNLATTLAVANRSLNFRWVLEVEIKRSLIVVLRPRPDPTCEADLEPIRRDVLELADQLHRDSRLSWWQR